MNLQDRLDAICADYDIAPIFRAWLTDPIPPRAEFEAECVEYDISPTAIVQLRDLLYK